MIVWVAALVLAAACATERPRSEGVPVTGTLHPRGILDPTSDEFHGRELARRDWDLDLCAICHGEDFSGGAANASCNDCHQGGPTACATCHPDGELTGAHRVHATAPVACSECHLVPDRWDAEGHLRRDGAVDPPPAEITFGARAQLTLAPGDRQGPPTVVEGRCTNVYCHGDVLHAGGGSETRPRWDDATPAGGCVRCHASPPPSHAQDLCTTCHPNPASSTAHIDGIVQVGRTSGCGGCHGSAVSPAPPTDLTGKIFTTAIGVGAHQAHLVAPSRLSGAIACASCHQVPTQIVETGHIDSPAPAEVTAALGWDRAAETCANAWCHGSARPVWTEQGGTSCGSCHGIPPSTPAHTPGQSFTSCATCHPRTIDSSGTILINVGPNGPTSEHIDGNLDLQ